jgi:hypothetical protein
MAEMEMPKSTIMSDGIEWVELRQAAKLSRTKSVLIEEQIRAGTIPSFGRDGKAYIPLTAANRLKREAATMIKARKLNKNGSLPPARRFGVLVKDTQDVLPMSSGRADEVG